MRLLFVIIFTSVLTQILGQERIKGTIVDLGTDKPINTSHKCFLFFLKGQNTLSINIDSTGQFAIEENELLKLGDTITISIGTLGTDFNYADFELKNVPLDKVQQAVEKLFVTKAFMIRSCGHDCFTVDNKRTYKKKSITVDNGTLRYIIRRTPERRPTNSPFDKVKYQTDFKKDLL